MRFVHLGDLHLGKRVHEFSMVEDQRYILDRILEIVRSREADAVLISGDVYDRSVPPVEAVMLFDAFLSALSAEGKNVFVISGNHDSPERLSFGAKQMRKSGVWISDAYSGEVQCVTLQDEFGPVHFHLLPFLKPSVVRNSLSDEKKEVEDSADAEQERVEIHTYQEAVEAAMQRVEIHSGERNVILSHQFVTGAQRSESEELNVGGLDQIDVSLYEPFDYAALGHIHRPQKIGRETVRYSGTPLKYSFSEAEHEKSVPVVTLLEKGNIEVEFVPLVPLHDLRKIRGTYEELTARENYQGTATEDYLLVTLTDEEDVPEAIHRLRTIYPNIMKMEYDNCRTRQNTEISAEEKAAELSPGELFAEFYRAQNNREPGAEQSEFLKELIEEIWREK